MSLRSCPCGVCPCGVLRSLSLRSAAESCGVCPCGVLAVESARLETGFAISRATVVLHVKTSDGYSARFKGENRSGRPVGIIYLGDGALMRAVVEMLKDPNIVSFLKNPSAAGGTSMQDISLNSKLKELKNSQERGYITEEEYEKAKQRILNNIQ